MNPNKNSLKRLHSLLFLLRDQLTPWIASEIKLTLVKPQKYDS